MGLNRWKLRITKLDADSNRNFTSKNPYDVMATLDGRAEMILEFGNDEQRARHTYTGFFSTMIMVKNY